MSQHWLSDWRVIGWVFAAAVGLLGAALWVRLAPSPEEMPPPALPIDSESTGQAQVVDSPAPEPVRPQPVFRGHKGVRLKPPTRKGDDYELIVDPFPEEGL